MYKWRLLYKPNFHFNTKQISLSISTENRPNNVLDNRIIEKSCLEGNSGYHSSNMHFGG